MSELKLDELMRRSRDAGMAVWARAALQVVSSPQYSRASFLLAQPGLIAAGFFRKATAKAMAQLLAQLNMPSREELLSVSQRLTHIETALDDLGATAARAGAEK